MISNRSFLFVCIFSFFLLINKSIAQQGKKNEGIDWQYDFKKSEKFYKKYYSSNQDSLTLKFADLVFAQGKYQQAFEAYRKADSLNMVFDIKRKSNYYHAANILKRRSPFFQSTNYFQNAANWNVSISPYSTNSSNEDIAPFCWNGNLFITSSRYNFKNKIKLGYDFNNLPFLDVYGFDSEGNELNLNKLLPKELNTDHHDGPIAISKDSTLLIINRNFIDPNDEGIFNLYFDYYVRNNKGWSSARKFYYTNPDYSVQHPFFDDKTNTLYFSSNMFGGFGGFDIYSIKWAGMHWEGLKNLGAEINTIYDELFPNLDLEGNLVYATNHMETYGGIDLVLFKNGIRYLLPTPINSEFDDFGLTFEHNGSGYFTSNRSNQLFNDQIYKFTLNRSYDTISLKQEKIVAIVKDTVMLDSNIVFATVVDTSINTVDSPIIAVLISAIDTVKIISAINPVVLDTSAIDSILNPIIYSDTIVKEDVKVILDSVVTKLDTIQVDSIIAVIVPVVLDTSAIDSILNPIIYSDTIVKEDVKVILDNVVIKADTINVDSIIATPAVKEEIIIPANDTLLPVIQSILTIDNQKDEIFKTIVYFNFDKYESFLDTNSALHKIINYMAVHPNKIVVLNGHTDKYGPYMYNIELSKKRAIILRRYIIAKGVNPAQIKYGIYGESRPLVKQRSKKASAINRRVEVLVIDKK
jgi:outer membrane protein OmpA-like peptidoglycan-associated protein